MKITRFLGLFFLALAILFSANTAYAETITAPASITADTVWSNDNVYVVQSTTTVIQGVSLNIDPGTVIKFKPYARMVIKGTLTAQGSDQANIVFTSYKDDTYGGDTNGDGTATVPVRGDWSCLESFPGGTVNTKYCIVRYGGNGYSMIYGTGGALNIEDCILEQSKGNGVEIKGSGSISNNQISSCTNRGIFVNTGSPLIDRNTVTGVKHGIYILNGSPAVDGNTINNSNTAGIYVAGGSPVITGNFLNGGAGNNVGVVVDNGTVTIENNTISQFYFEAVMLGSDGGTVSASVYGNIISDCMYPLGFRGNKIPSVTFGDNICSCDKYMGVRLTKN